MAVVYQDPKFLIFQKLHNQQNQTQWHKVNYSDFFLYQNASTSRILDTSPQGLISSYLYLKLIVRHFRPKQSVKMGQFQMKQPVDVLMH